MARMAAIFSAVSASACFTLTPARAVHVPVRPESLADSRVLGDVGKFGDLVCLGDCGTRHVEAVGLRRSVLAASDNGPIGPLPYVGDEGVGVCARG